MPAYLPPLYNSLDEVPLRCEMQFNMPLDAWTVMFALKPLYPHEQEPARFYPKKWTFLGIPKRRNRWMQIFEDSKEKIEKSLLMEGSPAKVDWESLRENFASRWEDAFEQNRKIRYERILEMQSS